MAMLERLYDHETAATYPLTADGHLHPYLQAAWGLTEKWEPPADNGGWYKLAVERRIEGSSRLALVSALLTTVAAGAISSPVSLLSNWPGEPSTFHVFVILTSIAFICLLSTTLFLSAVIWNVQREFSHDAFLVSTGKLPGFEMGFGAWRRLVKLTSPIRYLHTDVIQCSSWMFTSGCIALLAGFGVKVSASISDDSFMRTIVGIVYGAGATFTVVVMLSFSFERKSVRNRPGLVAR